PALRLQGLPADAAYALVVERGGERREVSLRRAERRDWRPILPRLPLLVTGVAFGLFSVLMLLNLSDPVARLFLYVGLSLTLRLGVVALFPLAPYFGPLESWVNYAAWCGQIGCAAAAYHAVSRFPAGVPAGRGWTALQWGLHAAAAVLFLFSVGRGAVDALPQPASVLRVFPDRVEFIPIEDAGPAMRITSTYVWLAMTGLAAVAVRNYRKLVHPGMRRRILWVIAGFTSAVLPLIVFMGIEAAVATPGRPYRLREEWPISFLWTQYVMVFAPVALSYAVVKHEIFDIRLVVRRSLQYVLAKNTLQALLLVPLAGLALGIAGNPDRTLGQLFFEGQGYWNLLLLVFAGASLRYRRPIRGWLDRKFFREEYDREEILAGLLDRVKNVDSAADVTRMVESGVSDTLHPDSFTLLILDKRGGGVESPALAGMLSASPGPAAVTDAVRARLPQPEAARIAGVRLLVPVLGDHRRLIGAMALGEKRSEEPYSAADRKLLMAIADQIALHIEKSWLREELAQEKRSQQEILVRAGTDLRNLMRECPACGRCYDSSAVTCSADGRVPVLVLPIDRTVDGKYRLERRIGKGGMGAVYRGEDVRLGRPVAIKVMLTELLGHEKAMKRFEREAQASARLSHTNIIRIYDYGAIGGLGAYMVMELVEGATWRDEIDRRKRIPATELAGWVEQLLSGIAAAHREGIIHRDLKPENVLLGREGLKILDFGLAKMKLLALAERERLTLQGVVLGTMGYMPPEQLAGSGADETSDLYSIAVMVAESLTGVEPPPGAGTMERISPPLRRVLARCLEKEPASRYRSAEELAEDLLPALRAAAASA
ncbi:MAG: protein kinase domain-containing protein, partial [Bryobacteraceae bacterium]